VILKNHLHFYASALSNKFCDEIVKYALTKKESIATIGQDSNPDADVKDLNKTRKSNIVWLNDPWIFKEIEPYINLANKEAEWNFNLKYCEAFQFTKYDGSKKQHYDWHEDQFYEPNAKGFVRKLSMTISLVDGSMYEGGDLEFDLRDGKGEKTSNVRVCKEIRPRGSIVVFPSFLLHRVKPVTSGVRYSLVVWSSGEPFK
jgi:PKHD-type hydroxylase|tara:strand:+ start:54 stop:656 length:603 start_codon:yes stop_codon:yes gene_type:complete